MARLIEQGGPIDGHEVAAVEIVSPYPTAQTLKITCTDGALYAIDTFVPLRIPRELDVTERRPAWWNTRPGHEIR